MSDRGTPGRFYGVDRGGSDRAAMVDLDHRGGVMRIQIIRIRDLPGVSPGPTRGEPQDG